MIKKTFEKKEVIDWRMSIIFRRIDKKFCEGKKEFRCILRPRHRMSSSEFANFRSSFIIYVDIYVYAIYCVCDDNQR